MMISIGYLVIAQIMQLMPESEDFILIFRYKIITKILNKCKKRVHIFYI